MWRFAGARAVGTSHIGANLACQDRFACEAVGGNALVAVVADGAGSADMAEQGAQIAVDTVMMHLKSSVERWRSDFGLLLVEAATLARKAVVDEATKQALDPRSYASTLLAVVLTSEGGSALQIGDGVIVVGGSVGDWDWVFWPQRGEYANTTHFLTDADALDRVEVVVFSRMIADVALMSDGLEPLALHYASRAVHEPFFRGMFEPLVKARGTGEVGQLSTSLQDFLSSDRVRSRTDDDVSLVLATRRNCPSR